MASTVAVSGATAADRPSPNRAVGSSTSTTYDEPGPIRDISSRAPAQSRMPAVIGSRGPNRLASSPARDDSSSIRIVTGIIEVPASSGEKPADTCSWTTRRKNTTPIAAYMMKVTTLTAVNTLDAKTSTGTSASGERLISSQTKAAPSSTPTVIGTIARSIRP